MKTKQSTNGLLYFREHLSCENYMTDTSTGFKYIKFDEGTSIEEEYAHKNYLLFFLKGDFFVYCNQYCNHRFHSNEMVVLPKRMEIVFVIPESCDSRDSCNTPGTGGVMGTMS